MISISGLLPLAIGLRWLQLFVLTDYRHLHRPVMIPLGIVATLIGLAIVAAPWLTWLMVGLLVRWSERHNRRIQSRHAHA